MGCYWGCETTGNKVAWASIFSFLVIGVVLLCGGAIGGTLAGEQNCFKVYNDCTNEYGSSRESRDLCSDLADAQCRFILWVSLLAAGLACIVLGCTLPMIYFAFSDDPDEVDEEATPVSAKTQALPDYGAPAPAPRQYSGAVPVSHAGMNPYGMAMPRPPQDAPPQDAMMPAR